MAETDTIHILETELQTIINTEYEGPASIGLVANEMDSDETRFLLTPEACGVLTSSGLRLIMESGAATDISFTDDAYAEYGVEIADRVKALAADIVLSFRPLKPADVALMKDEATLLTVLDGECFEASHIKAYLDKKITLGCLDNMISHNDAAVFRNVLDEIDGRAAIMYAQDSLSFLGEGKGVLLAGVAGINPCEVLIIGEGDRVNAAARAALAAGAYVTLMNNDISALQDARLAVSPNLITAAMHPRVLFNKVKSADVILLDGCTRPFTFPRNLSAAMKESVYILDFNETHPSISVPRTVAMGLSNTLVNFFSEMILKNSFQTMLATTPGVQCGIITYKGKLVDKLTASYLGMPSVDIAVMIAGTN